MSTNNSNGQSLPKKLNIVTGVEAAQSLLEQRTTGAFTDREAVETFRERFEIFENSYDHIADLPTSQLFGGYDIKQDMEVTIERFKPGVSIKVSDETRFMRGLAHQNVVRINDFNDELCWIVLDGLKTCLANVKKKDLDPKLVLLSLLEAVRAVHDRGALHGRIAPGCIFRGQDNAIKLGRTPGYALDGSDLNIDRVDDTFYYRAPEQINDEWGKQGPHSDLFCVGLAILHLCHGQEAHRNFLREPHQWVGSKERFPERLLNHRIIPEEIRPILKRLVEKDPARRYRSAEDALTDLTPNKNETEGKDATKGTGSVDAISIRRPPSARKKEAVAEPIDWKSVKKSLKEHLAKPLPIGIGLMLLTSIIAWRVLTGESVGESDYQVTLRVKVDGDYNSLAPELTIDGSTPEQKIAWIKSDRSENTEYSTQIELSPNQYEFEVRMAGFRANQQARALRKAKESIEFQMVPIDFELAVSATTARPDLFDGKRYDVTVRERNSQSVVDPNVEVDDLGRRTWSLDQGEYEIEASMDGHQSMTETLDAKVGESKNVDFKLEPARVPVTLVCDPVPADLLLVDGKAIASSNGKNATFQIERIPGETAKIMARAKGFKPIAATYKIESKNEIVNLKFSERRSTQPEGTRQYEIYTVDEPTGELIKGLKMYVDKKPVPTPEGRQVTPLTAYVTPGFHVVEFKNDEGKTVYRFDGSRFAEKANRPMYYEIRDL